MSSTNWPDVDTALIGAVSGVGGLATAGLALWQNHRFQSQLAALEKARRLDETRPDLTLTEEPDREHTSLAIRNLGPSDLEHVEILAVVERPAVIVKDVESLVGAHFPLRLGGSMKMTVERNEDGAGGPLVLRVLARSSDGEWELPLSCDVPGPPSDFAEVIHFS